jgi:hypothetical protein
MIRRTVSDGADRRLTEEPMPQHRWIVVRVAAIPSIGRQQAESHRTGRISKSVRILFLAAGGDGVRHTLIAG